MRQVVVLLVMLLAACSPASTAAKPAPQVTTGPSSPARAPDTGPDDPGESSAGPAGVAYSSSVRSIGPRLRYRMRFSHSPGCPVPLRDLRYLRMRYVGFDGSTHNGEMVVHEDFAQAVTAVFGKLHDARWPIQRMRLVDVYRGDDNRSMAANNTSGYNCRRVAGSRQWSAHAYGAAIDVNPVQNPYLTGSSIAPRAGSRFAAIDRTARARVPAGAIRAGDVVVKAFARVGWEWGGWWSQSKDYQHFSSSGG